MVDVGDAYLRIGEVAELRPAVQAKARNAYLAALFRARRHESFEGLLRVAEGYAGLGDRDVAEQCLRLAGPLAARSHDPAGYTRVKALQDGLSAQVVGTERL